MPKYRDVLDSKHKNILVSPMDWGLGHTTRVLKIIRRLDEHNTIHILASGRSYVYLKSTFPHIRIVEIPGYNIWYYSWFWLDILFQIPKILRTIFIEHRIVRRYVKQHNIDSIISDNRYGVFSKSVTSSIITHQIYFSHLPIFIRSIVQYSVQYMLRYFDAVWVPDSTQYKLSGAMGFTDKINGCLNIEYIGILSHFERKKMQIKYDILCILTGPKTSIVSFEKRYIKLFQKLGENRRIAIVGAVLSSEILEPCSNITIYNTVDSSILNTIINQSHIVISRAGYTTIMDMVYLKKPMLCIPEKGQFEQIYLSKHIDRSHNISVLYERDLNIVTLKKIITYLY